MTSFHVISSDPCRAHEVALFPGLFQRAECGQDVARKVRACGGVDGLGKCDTWLSDKVRAGGQDNRLFMSRVEIPDILTVCVQ